MNLEEIKNGLKTICLSHKAINDFEFGEDSLVSSGKKTKYPLAYLEIPYNVNYELDNNRWKTFQFALLILLNPSNDDVVNDHKSISKGEIIGDSIITKLQNDFPQLALDSVNGVSLRQHSTANASGFRFDLTVRTPRACFDSNDLTANG